MGVVRRNIRSLSKWEQDDVVKAFAGIQALPPSDPNSYFTIAGYHGEPFRGAGYSNQQWWGGYCNHGNVLFPTWHRAYLCRIEQALQTIVPGVALPYWDETEEESLKQGLPRIFLHRQWTYEDGTVVDNPLFSYKFQTRITDRLSPVPDANYTKPIGYKTVRYPFSGLVGTDDNTKITLQYNEWLEAKGSEHTDELLNQNLTTWLNATSFHNTEGKLINAGVKDQWAACLNAPNYTVFSNTTSAQQWNEEHLDEPGHTTVVPLESPHNSIHLAVGGFSIPTAGDNYATYDAPRANGDMGENDTASFDPLFFIHHAWCDLMFAMWQQRTGNTETFDIIPAYSGTNSVDSQGPTPGVAGGTWLTVDSPLEPFKRPDGTSPLTSRDMIDWTKLGYSYEYEGVHGTIPAPKGRSPHRGPPAPSADPAPVLVVSNINRANIGGSFLVHAWTTLPGGGTGNKVLVGTEAVLSRWHVSGCINCQKHLEVRVHMPLYGWSREQAEEMHFDVTVVTRQDTGGGGGRKGDDGMNGSRIKSVLDSLGLSGSAKWELRTSHCNDVVHRSEKLPRRIAIRSRL